jgi:hypothetical protein
VKFAPPKLFALIIKIQFALAFVRFKDDSDVISTHVLSLHYHPENILSEKFHLRFALNVL